MLQNAASLPEIPSDFSEREGDTTLFASRLSPFGKFTPLSGVSHREISVRSAWAAALKFIADLAERLYFAGRLLTSQQSGTTSQTQGFTPEPIWSTSNKQVATVDGGVVTAVAEGVAEITVTTDDGGKEAHCSVTVESSSKPTSVIVTGEYTDLACTTVSVCGWCYQKEEEGLSAIYGIEYSDTDFTTAATTVKAESKGQDNKFCCKLTRLIPNAKYFYRAYVLFNGIRTYGEVKTFTTTKPSCPSGAVDLGLSVCWATCNIGASKPEDYGGYYQWAGTKDVTRTLTYLDWSNCPYHIGSNQHTGWTKYYEGDNKVVLDLSDDVAYVTLGESWRMPTARECDELIDKCTWVWTTRNGVNGYAVKGNRSGYTDKSIFLPMEGNSAYYWCASCFFIMMIKIQSMGEPYISKKALSILPLNLVTLACLFAPSQDNRDVG